MLVEDLIKQHQAMYSQRHGGPYDRGSADSYYRRGFEPHYYVGDSHNSTRLDLVDMSANEIAAYTAGYADNELLRNWKDWR